MLHGNIERGYVEERQLVAEEVYTAKNITGTVMCPRVQSFCFEAIVV
jgi:hypothetical protein